MGTENSSGNVAGGCSTTPCGTKDALQLDADKAISSSSEDYPINFTPAAIVAAKQAIAEEGEVGDGLRVSVIGGGCSGYQYNLDFDRDPRIGDFELNFDGLVVFVDPISAGYLKGTVVDYLSGLNEQGFKFNNPNAKRTCGCGSSFS
jgi:iron-sulfur cluster assembly accessory protein